MKSISLLFLCVFVSNGRSKLYNGVEVNKNVHLNLDKYDFYPRLDACYEVEVDVKYPNEVSCRQENTDEKPRYCVEELQTGYECWGITIPTNETIEIGCGDDELESSQDCFRVYKNNEFTEETCLLIYENSVGIETPENATIMLFSAFCDPGLPLNYTDIYKNFTDNFILDPARRSCYKIYEPEKDISPYNCAENEIYSACAQEWSDNASCLAVTTPNNETVVLGCINEDKKSCFKVYSANGTNYEACQEEVGESCVGIRTATNWTVLLECYFCWKPEEYVLDPTGNGKIRYDYEYQLDQRNFVKSYMIDEYQGKHTYFNKTFFNDFHPKDYVQPNEGCDMLTFTKSYTYWIPDTKCFGLKLSSKETIKLHCLDDSTTKPGCYKVTHPRREESIVCTKIVEERCVGITTPLNHTITLGCLPEADCRDESLDSQCEDPLIDEPEEYVPDLDVNYCYKMYAPGESVDGYSCTKKSSENYVCLQYLPGDIKCLGFKTPANETVKLNCSETMNKDITNETKSYNLNCSETIKDNITNETETVELNCSNAMNSNISGETRENSGSYCFTVTSAEDRSDVICVDKLGKHAFGFTTPMNYTFLLESTVCEAYKTTEELANSTKFIEDFKFNPKVRSCYKIYTPQQEEQLSPYSCLSTAIFESCVDYNASQVIKTQNNETIFLDSNAELSKKGCFRLLTPDNTEHIVCQSKIEERCVGFKTPSNLTVLLECTSCISAADYTLPSYTSKQRLGYRNFVQREMERYQSGNYSFRQSEAAYIYNPNPDTFKIPCEGSKRRDYVHKLPRNRKCLGLVTYTGEEVIELQCSNKKRTGCFDIYSPTRNLEGKLLGDVEKVATSCVKVVNERCVGIVTPKNWTIALSCLKPDEEPEPLSPSVPPILKKQ